MRLRQDCFVGRAFESEFFSLRLESNCVFEKGVGALDFFRAVLTMFDFVLVKVKNLDNGSQLFPLPVILFEEASS